VSEPPEKKPIIPFRIAEDGKVDLTDLCILEKLIDGKSIRDVAEELHIAEKTVSNRLDSMERNKLIVKKQAPIVDILQLYNFLFITYVKVHLSAAIAEAAMRTNPLAGMPPVPSTPAPPSWLEVLEAIKETDKQLFSKIVRYAFVVMGTEWDLVLIISTQSIEEYTRFFSQLQHRGFIEKVLGQPIVSFAGYHYDPIAVPDSTELVEGLKQMQKFLVKNKEVVP
jgi:DNA-binding Lrp family transcriptional regulator